MKLILILTGLLLVGCSSLPQAERTKSGKGEISLVIKDVDGCKEKISFSGRKLRYTKCF